MKFVEVAEAKNIEGMRLVLARGAWALWSEFTKNICHVKRIPFVAIAQKGFEDNRELVEWTGVRNQPQAVYNDEPVRSNWLDILNLCERIAPEPRLLPEDSEERSAVIGLSNEICGEWGLGWCRRIQIAAIHPFEGEAALRMRKEYGQTDSNARAAELRVADIVGFVGRRLHAQARAGSPYLVGKALSAADIYWACASNLVGPLPASECPLGEGLRDMFAQTGSAIGRALDPIVFKHRDYIYQNHLIYPVTFE